MEDIGIKTVIHLVWNDRLVRNSAVFVFSTACIVSIFASCLLGILLLASYIGGFLAFNSIFKYRSEVPNVLSFLTGTKKPTFPIIHCKPCAVCGSGKCKRHKPNLQTYQPWQDLDIPEELDEAVEEFLNRTLNEFVQSWYQQLSVDESFILELKHSIRYASCVILQRALQVDVAHVILDKLIPVGLAHLDDYLGSVRVSKRQKLPLEKAAEQFLGPKLHPAARNRENELEYLRQITVLLLPQLLPSHQLQCKNFTVLIREVLSGWVLLPLMDVFADPSIVNSLLLLLLERQSLTHYPSRPANRVEFLSHFVCGLTPPHISALRLDIANVLKDQELLYPFMQFLKGEGSVNVLQFCLDVEEFNRKMLTPDLKPQDLENLYKEAWDLYSVYFSPASPDHIAFNPAVVHEMHSVLQEPAENIVKLRTTPPLFQAYEFAYSQLENILGPLFHQSDAYYTLLCGQRLPSGYNKSGSRSNKRATDVGTVAKLSSRLHKIKGVLRVQPVDGQVMNSDSAVDLGESEFADNMPLPESSPHRDLSAWRVSIPSVENRQDINNKPYPVFNINVQRIDVNSDDDPESCHWIVDRKYNDFYVLESKLTEFHGEFTDVYLPPKPLLFGPKGIEYMESKRQLFEEFLQRLLQKPNLRGSDLLHSFLHSSTDFVPVTTGIAGAMPEGLGRMIRRSVPLRLRKERGQHLENFLNTFVTSTETSKPKPSKFEWKDMNINEYPQQVRCLSHSVFGDNFGVSSKQLLFALSGSHNSSFPIHGFYDCLLYLVVRLFDASQTVLRLLLAVRAIIHNTFNAVCWFYLDRKLKKLLVAPRLAHLVNLLQVAVFEHKNSPTQRDLDARANRVLEKLKLILPSILTHFMGSCYQEGIETLFHMIQNPALNKQLAYLLLDVVAVELFPDLVTGEISPQP